MPNQPVPEESVEAAVSGLPESWRETITEAVERAAPAIRKQEREQILTELRARGSISAGLEEMTRQSEREQVLEEVAGEVAAAALLRSRIDRLWDGGPPDAETRNVMLQDCREDLEAIVAALNPDQS